MERITTNRRTRTRMFRMTRINRKQKRKEKYKNIDKGKERYIKDKTEEITRKKK